MATRKECICIENAAGIIKDAKILEESGRTLDTLTRMYEERLYRDIKESSMMMVRDNAQNLRVGIKSFEHACDISKLGTRLDQYQLGKDKLEQFRKEPENLNLAIDAGRKIYGAVFSKIGKGLIECKL